MARGTTTKIVDSALQSINDRDWCINSKQRGQEWCAIATPRKRPPDTVALVAVCCCLLAAWCLQGSDCSCCSRLVLKLTVCSHAELWRQLLVGWDDVQGQWPGTSGPYHAGSQHLGGPPLEACKMINIHYSQTSLTQALVTAKPHSIRLC